MDHNDRDKDDEQGRRRRPYAPPSVRESAMFETLALGCTEVNPEIDDCNPDLGGVPGAS